MWSNNIFQQIIQLDVSFVATDIFKGIHYVLTNILEIFLILLKMYVVSYEILNEDMIFALAGQFKQLTHEPEKFRWLNEIRTHDLCDAGEVL